MDESDLESKREELKELLSGVEGLKMQKAWRVEAIKWLKTTK